MRLAGIELLVVALAPSALGRLLEAVSPNAVSVVLIGVGGIFGAVGWGPGQDPADRLI